MKTLFIVVAVVVTATGVNAQLKDPPNAIDIGIAGSDFGRIPKGEWHALLEQAVIMVRTTDDQMWLFNFGQNGRHGKKFQSLLVERACVAKQPDFVSLDAKCVRQRQVWTWAEIKTFLQEKMLTKEFRSMVSSIEEYLRKQKLL